MAVVGFFQDSVVFCCLPLVFTGGQVMCKRCGLFSRSPLLALVESCDQRVACAC